MKPATSEDWNTNPLPTKRATIHLDRSFSPEEIGRIRQGLIPAEMEDKWFIYWHEGTLYFHRSWTGYCIYAVRIVQDGDSWQMTSAELNRDPEQYKEADDSRDAQMVSYLVDVLLLHRQAAFPSSEHSDEKRTLQQWSQVGRAMLGEHPESSE